jgi:hypothetical protein
MLSKLTWQSMFSWKPISEFLKEAHHLFIFSRSAFIIRVVKLKWPKIKTVTLQNTENDPRGAFVELRVLWQHNPAHSLSWRIHRHPYFAADQKDPGLVVRGCHHDVGMNCNERWCRVTMM